MGVFVEGNADYAVDVTVVLLGVLDRDCVELAFVEIGRRVIALVLHGSGLGVQCCLESKAGLTIGPGRGGRVFELLALSTSALSCR